MINIRNILALVVLFSSNVLSDTYYVSSSTGNDSWDGTSGVYTGGLSGPWATIGMVNSVASSSGFNDGDAIKFKRGDVFDDSTLTSPGASNITIEDYDSGPKPHFNGDVIKPVNISDPNIRNLTIRNIDISGQDWALTHSNHLLVEYVNGVTIDGISGDGHYGGNAPGQIGKSAIVLSSVSGLIIINNCDLENWGPEPLLAGNNIDLMGITIRDVNTGSVFIENNVIRNIEADGVHLSANHVRIYVKDNLFYNFGEQAVDIKGSDDVEVTGNEFYTEPGFAAGTGGTGGGIPTFIKSSLAPAHTHNNICIHDNYFHDSPTIAIRVAQTDNADVYNNRIERLKGGIFIADLVTNSIFHHNVILDPDELPLPAPISDAGGIYENNSGAGNRIFNNSIYNVAGSSLQPFSVMAANATIIRNNIVQQDKVDPDAWPFRSSGSTLSGPVVSHNIWYSSTSPNRVLWESLEFRTDTSYPHDEEGWRENHPEGYFSDPMFVTLVGSEVRITSGPAIDTGSTDAWPAGTPEEDMLDFDGNKIYNLPDRGAQELQPAPIINNVTPGELPRGSTTEFVLAGEFFQANASVVVSPSERLDIGEVIVDSPNQIRVPITASQNARKKRTHGITVTNPDTQSYTFGLAFEVVK
jgi:hypothetical protein